MARKGKQKKVSTPHVKAKEVPRRSVLPGAETSDDRICWRFCHVDHDGPWGFDKVDPLAMRDIMQWLSKMESMTVREIFSGHPGKDYDVDALPNGDAVRRLDVLGLADMTKIWRLRATGKGRLYGFLHGNVFHVVWWDPEHEIWPTPLKYT